MRAQRPGFHGLDGQVDIAIGGVGIWAGRRSKMHAPRPASPGTKIKLETSWRIKENPSRPDKGARFWGLPVMKLSIPMTSWPSCSKRLHRCEPRNPAAPVMSTRISNSSISLVEPGYILRKNSGMVPSRGKYPTCPGNTGPLRSFMVWKCPGRVPKLLVYRPHSGKGSGRYGWQVSSALTRRKFIRHRHLWDLPGQLLFGLLPGHC